MSDRQNIVIEQNRESNGQSDFSIDHILNRAGEKCKRVEDCEQCPKLNVIMITEKYFNRTNRPQFDWLQYTRYRPPRLPRPNRQTPAKRTPGRLPRIPFTSSQLNSLEEAYRLSTYLSAEDANEIAKKLELTNTRVKIWFQNRRARERREKKLPPQSPELQLDDVEFSQQNV